MTQASGSTLLKFLLVTQDEVPFINTSEVTKRSSNRKDNSNCTNVTNRRSRVGLSTPFYTKHCYNWKTPDLFWWEFSLSHIFTDLITDYYRSNQSALMTRCWTDFCHQYGIFCGESQTSFTRNATRAGSEEGRLFLQAKERLVIEVLINLDYVRKQTLLPWVMENWFKVSRKEPKRHKLYDNRTKSVGSQNFQELEVKNF